MISDKKDSIILYGIAHFVYFSYVIIFSLTADEYITGEDIFLMVIFTIAYFYFLIMNKISFSQTYSFITEYKSVIQFIKLMYFPIMWVIIGIIFVSVGIIVENVIDPISLVYRIIITLIFCIIPISSLFFLKKRITINNNRFLMLFPILIIIHSIIYLLISLSYLDYHWKFFTWINVGIALQFYGSCRTLYLEYRLKKATDNNSLIKGNWDTKIKKNVLNQYSGKMKKVMEMLKVLKKLNIKTASEILNVNENDFIDIVIQNLDNFEGILIDCDDIILDAQYDIDEFINYLDRQFRIWQNENSKKK